MPTLIVSLSDILLDPQKPVDLSHLPVDQAIRLIKQSYGFLSSAVEVTLENGVATITLPEENSKKINQALEWFNRGIKKAQQGDYQGAIQLLQRTLEYLPAHTEARRNLAMAHLELGNAEEALNHLIDVLRLDPKDTWGYVLLGNIYVKHKKDAQTGEQFYKKALTLNSSDPYLVNNCGAVQAVKGETDEAESMFKKAIENDPSYPNSFFGLATLCSRLNRKQEALAALQNLFNQPVATDPRSATLYDHSRALFLSLNLALADENYEAIMAFVHSRAIAVERITGYPVEIIEDDTLQGVTAKSELAWRHKTHRHLIRHRSTSKSIVPHLIMHEMEHILLEHEARKTGKNRIFVVTEEQKRYGRQQIENDLGKLDNLGLDRSAKEEIMSRWFFGLTNQLYNCPLDMVIEQRLHDKYPDLRPFQFASVAQLQADNLKVLTEPEIRRVSPRLILRSNIAMNCAYALFSDWLYHQATEYSNPYMNSEFFPIGESLFAVFLDRQTDRQTDRQEVALSKFERNAVITSRNETWRRIHSHRRIRTHSPAGRMVFARTGSAQDQRTNRGGHQPRSPQRKGICNGNVLPRHSKPIREDANRKDSRDCVRDRFTGTIRN